MYYTRYKDSGYEAKVEEGEAEMQRAKEILDDLSTSCDRLSNKIQENERFISAQKVGFRWNETIIFIIF